MKHLTNIHRIDNPNNRTFAWLVRVQRNNLAVTKMFTDAVYGSKQDAMQAAIDFRDEILSEANPFEHQLWRRTILRRNNTSGIPGVSRHDQIANPNTGRRRVFWLASWVNEDGFTRQRKFSVLMHGELGAKRLAVAERERQLKRVIAAKCEKKMTVR
jgi:hypothetical protein